MGVKVAEERLCLAARRYSMNLSDPVAKRHLIDCALEYGKVKRNRRNARDQWKIENRMPSNGQDGTVIHVKER